MLYIDHKIDLGLSKKENVKMGRFLKFFIIFTIVGIYGCTCNNAPKIDKMETASTLFKEEKIRKHNKEKFLVLKKYNLPIDQYAIVGSGPLGIRNIRKINDIDIVVTHELRDALIKKYGITYDGQVKKIKLSENNIEIFWQGSFYPFPENKHDPAAEDIIARAEIIDNLPFACLSDVLYFKRKVLRSKDVEDIRLIEFWKKSTEPN